MDQQSKFLQLHHSILFFYNHLKINRNTYQTYYLEMRKMYKLKKKRRNEAPTHKLVTIIKTIMVQKNFNSIKTTNKIDKN